ncbi:MAG TPA: chitobiase/beta-hexosaminidase C-terminal domain-containing protein, partial [Verrucomicrobiales bacterium]|nr:chitobiase/beta-hexosaminidase C-terminal domain-containing protein [Verrucomicrobiales bacterium]
MTRPLCAFALLAVLCLRAAAEPAISEFVASNDTGLADEDGDRSDWIELYNESGTVSLLGWHLTDSKDDRAKWTFPAVSLGPRQTLVVFASSKNRATPGAPLHTNFSLSSRGGYLALTRPDRSVAVEFDEYPAQFSDHSYGTAQTVVRTDFLTSNAAVKWRVPADDSLGTTWTAPGFNDAAWATGTSGLGFEPQFPGFAVKAVQASVNVSSLSTAETVLSTPSQQSQSDTENRAVIDYWNTGATGNYGGNFQPPGMNGSDVDNVVIECTGIVTIPSAGAWTFGVNSNDGFGLTVGTFSASLPGTTSGAVQTLNTFTFPAAGDYPLRLVFFSSTGGAEVELYAAQGTRTSWTAAVFDLVGDTANGGLAVKAPLTGPGSVSLAPHIRTAVTGMQGASSSLYARFPFNVPNPSAVTSLTLPVRYDDGLALYLNGTEILRRNAPAGALTNLSTASATRSNTDAGLQENLDLTAFKSLLVSGSNVLAVHALNASAADTDFLLQPELAQITVTPGAQQFFTAPTPGTFNTTPVYNRVAPVVASQSHGFFTAPFSLTLSTGSSGAQIRYTYDGSAPTASSALYSGPVTVNKTTTLRAIALKAGSDPSPVLTQTYVFLSDVLTQPSTPPVITNPPGSPTTTTTWPTTPVNGQKLDYGMDPNIVNVAPWNATITNDLKSLPALSLVTDLANLFDPATGVYVNANNNGDAWERACSMELIFPDGSKEGFQQDCGVRIRGNFSRDGNNPKHSLRFFFRDQYGSGKLRYPIFGQDGPPEQDVVDLRTSQDYSWAYLGSSDAHFIGDIFARDLMTAMGRPSTRGSYYHVYINGQYWGVYDTEERINPSFCVQHFGATEDDWDIIKTNAFNIEAASGGDSDYNLLWQKTEAASITTLAGYMETQGLNPDGTRNPAFKPLLDPAAMTDYMLMNFIIDNEDGPTFIGGSVVNNYFAIRARNADLPWAYLAHDSEYSFMNLSADITGNYGVGSTYNAANPRRFMERCLLNPEYRILFADRVQKHFFNGGALTPAKTAAAYLARKNEIDRAIVGESARWGDALNGTPLTREDDWLPRVNDLLNTWFPQRTGIVLNQLKARGYFPSLNAPLFTPQRGGTLAFGAAITLQNPNATGNVIFTTDGSDPRAIGGAVSASALTYSSPVSLTASMTIRTRVLDGSTWSALDEATFFPAQTFGSLALTEIHYNPLPSGAVLSDDLEFVELKNTGTTTLDLGGCHFTAG